jgi:hypothetical protein
MAHGDESGRDIAREDRFCRLKSRIRPLYDLSLVSRIYSCACVASARLILRQVRLRAGDGVSQLHAIMPGMGIFINCSLLMLTSHRS